MLAKRDEVNRIRANWSSAVESLAVAYEKYVDVLGKPEVAHLDVWHRELTAANRKP